MARIPSILLDIEGTVCPISFVHDVLFPYALDRAKVEITKLKFPLKLSEDSTEIAQYLWEFPAQYRDDKDGLIAHIEYLITNDVKATYLKALQGYLWKSGYESGEITAPLFDDVAPTLSSWSKDTNLYVYSSGSVPAQKLLFKHTNAGDLTPLFSGYYDTKNAGPKTDAASYKKICQQIGIKPEDIRFYSDNPKEIDAADASGLKTTFITRHGNPDYTDYRAPGQCSSELSLP